LVGCVGALVICCRSLSYPLCDTFFRNILFSCCAILDGGLLMLILRLLWVAAAHVLGLRCRTVFGVTGVLGLLRSGALCFLAA